MAEANGYVCSGEAMTLDPLEDGEQEFGRWRNKYFWGGISFEMWPKALEDAWQAAWTARAAREREWIPVKERLPELARKVLVYRDGSVCEGEYQGKFGWHVWATWRQDVTYWMPLPDPPEAALTENSNVR